MQFSLQWIISVDCQYNCPRDTAITQSTKKVKTFNYGCSWRFSKSRNFHRIECFKEEDIEYAVSRSKNTGTIAQLKWNPSWANFTYSAISIFVWRIFSFRFLSFLRLALKCFCKFLKLLIKAMLRLQSCTMRVHAYLSIQAIGLVD